MIFFNRKGTDYMPLLVLAVTLILSINKGLIYLPRCYFAYGIVLLATVFYFLKRKKIYYWIIEILLLLWAIDLLYFSPYNIFFSFSFHSFGLTIQLYPIILLALCQAWFPDSFLSYMKGDSNQHVENENIKKQPKTNKFLARFDLKSDDQLKVIANDHERLEEAREAAIEILEKRKSGDQ